MTEIEQVKTFWKRSTMEIITYTEGSLADIIQLARKDILSLIATIESQQREIQLIDSENKGYLHSLKLKRDEIESQKEEIEKLKEQIAHLKLTPMQKMSRSMEIIEKFRSEEGDK